LKILLVCWGDPFIAYVGTEIYVRNLAIELAQQGHDVHIIYGGKEHSGSKARNLTTHPFQPINIPYVRALDFRRKCADLCTRVINKCDVDTVIVSGAGTFASYIFNKIKKLASKPLLIYYAMDSMVMEYERSKASNEAKGLLTSFKRLIRYNALIKSDKASCLNSDLILASSRDTMNHLIADYGISPTKINILYEGVPDDFADGIDISDPNIPTFLHIAGGPRKGTDFFLEAIKLLEDKYSLRAKAVIIRASQSNIKQAEDLGIETKAYKYVSPLKLKRQYASCTAFVSPSLSEGFCLPVVEAAMFGKPSVVTNIGSLPELVTNGENGLVIPVADVNLLAGSLHRIAINTELRRKMGENARNRAENFTISSTASNLLTLAEEFKR
jgi:glycosyltransferase involved in cell wall biosynthesis